jgi:hypothetical protein
VIEEALDAVVDQLVAPVLQHLSHDQASCVTHPLGLGSRCLQAAEFLDDLVQKDHDIAAGEEAIEGVGIFDKS